MPASDKQTLAALDAEVGVLCSDSASVTFTIQTTSDWDGELWLEGTNTLTDFALPHYAQLTFRHRSGEESGAAHTAANTTVMYEATIAGLERVRVRVESYVAGSATVKINTHLLLSSVFLAGALPPGGNLLGTIQLTDGVQDATIRALGSAGALDMALVDEGGLHLTALGGFTVKPSATLTRPANTTAYTAEDEVGTNGTSPLAVTVARANGKTGFIVGARMIYSSTPAADPGFRVLLFGVSVTLAGDNAPLALADADAAQFIGMIDLDEWQEGGANSSDPSVFQGAPRAPIAFDAEGGAAVVYAALVTKDGFTPIANSETLILRLDTSQD